MECCFSWRLLWAGLRRPPSQGRQCAASYFLGAEFRIVVCGRFPQCDEGAKSSLDRFRRIVG